MSQPQPWPGPQGPAPEPPPPPPSPKQSSGTGKVVGWAVAGSVLWCALLVAGLFLASSLTGGAVLPGFLAAGSSAPLPVQEPAGGGAPSEKPSENSDESSGKEASGSSAEPAAQAPEQQQPAQPVKPEPSFHVSADDANPHNYSAADKAYCKWEGTLRYVAASEQFRAAICVINGQATYLGLDKKSGLTTRLPAVIGSDSAMARKDKFTYYLDADVFRIEESGEVLAEQVMDTWWRADAEELRLPGDLGLSKPMAYPACDGTGVLVLQTFFDPATNIPDIQAALDKDPGADYLRTDLSCDNFRNPSIDNSYGNAIYAVFRTLKADEAAMCSAMKELNAGGDWLENNVDPVEKIQCP